MDAALHSQDVDRSWMSEKEKLRVKIKRLSDQLKLSKNPEGPWIGEVAHTGTARFGGQMHLDRSTVVPGYDKAGAQMDVVLGLSSRENRIGQFGSEIEGDIHAR